MLDIHPQSYDIQPISLKRKELQRCKCTFFHYKRVINIVYNNFKGFIKVVMTYSHSFVLIFFGATSWHQKAQNLLEHKPMHTALKLFP